MSTVASHEVSGGRARRLVREELRRHRAQSPTSCERQAAGSELHLPYSERTGKVSRQSNVRKWLSGSLT